MDTTGPTFDTVLDMVIFFLNSGMVMDGKLKFARNFFVFRHGG